MYRTQGTKQEWELSKSVSEFLIQQYNSMMADAATTTIATTSTTTIETATSTKQHLHIKYEIMTSDEIILNPAGLLEKTSICREPQSVTFGAIRIEVSLVSYPFSWPILTSTMITWYVT